MHPPPSRRLPPVFDTPLPRSPQSPPMPCTRWRPGPGRTSLLYGSPPSSSTQIYRCVPHTPPLSYMSPCLALRIHSAFSPPLPDPGHSSAIPPRPFPLILPSVQHLPFAPVWPTFTVPHLSALLTSRFTFTLVKTLSSRQSEVARSTQEWLRYGRHRGLTNSDSCAPRQTSAHEALQQAQRRWDRSDGIWGRLGRGHSSGARHLAGL